MTVQEFIEHNQGKTLELQDVKVPIKEPKYKCKNKHFQKLLIKIFGYQITYETRRAKVIINKAEDYPFDNFDGNFTFTIEGDN